MADAAPVGNNHHHRAEHIHQRHHGHQPGGNRANALDTAKQHHSHNHCHQQANGQTGHRNGLSHHCNHSCTGIAPEGIDGGIDGGGNGIDLGHITGSDGSNGCQKAENHGQPGPIFAKAVLDVIHGTAHIVTLGVALPVMDGKNHLGIFGHHAEQGAEPHPEHCPRAAQSDGAGNTGNIAGTHGCRQRSGHSLKGGNLTMGCLFLSENPAGSLLHNMAEFGKLDKADLAAEVNSGTHQKHQHPRAPGYIIQYFKKL